MSYNRMLATKDYGKFLIDRCYETEPYKFTKYDSSVDELKKLIDDKYIDENMYKGKSCVIVTSGGSVLEKELGCEIDKFDLVVRTNLATFEGFEKHAGSRTDVRFMSHKTFGNTLKNEDFSAYDIDYIPNSNSHLIIRSAGNVGSMMPGFAMNKKGKNKFSILDLDYNLHLDRLADNRHFCTVGFSAVYTMMNFGCDVSIYGFDFYDPSKACHYFEEVSTIANRGRENHNVLNEKKQFDYLIEIGKIKRLQ